MMETRRSLLRSAVGGFALAASGLFLPTGLDDVEARKGALDGDEGGRRGNDRKGRSKKRTRGDKKENDRNESKPLQGHGPFRTVALTINQSSNRAVQWDFTFYYRQKTGGDEYGPWIESGTTVMPNAAEAHRYAPDRYRVGVLLKGHHFSAGLMPEQVFVDVRNVSFGYPLGTVYTGTDLNPLQNKLGTAKIGERDYAQPRDWFGNRDAGSTFWDTAARGSILLFLSRLNDSDNFIEFQFYANA